MYMYIVSCMYACIYIISLSNYMYVSWFHIVLWGGGDFVLELRNWHIAYFLRGVLGHAPPEDF